MVLAPLVPDTMLLNLLQPQHVHRSSPARSRGCQMALLLQLQEIGRPTLRDTAKPQLQHCIRLSSGRVPGTVPHLRATILQGHPSMRSLPRMLPPIRCRAAFPQPWLRQPARRLQAGRILQDLHGLKRMPALASKRLLCGRMLASGSKENLAA